MMTLYTSPASDLLEMIARRAPQLMRVGGIIPRHATQANRPPITNIQVAEMVRRLQGGQTLQEIADAMGLLRDSVARHTRHARPDYTRKPRRAA